MVIAAYRLAFAACLRATQILVVVSLSYSDSRSDDQSSGRIGSLARLLATKRWGRRSLCGFKIWYRCWFSCCGSWSIGRNRACVGRRLGSSSHRSWSRRMRSIGTWIICRHCIWIMVRFAGTAAAASTATVRASDRSHRATRAIPWSVGETEQLSELTQCTRATSARLGSSKFSIRAARIANRRLVDLLIPVDLTACGSTMNAAETVRKSA